MSLDRLGSFWTFALWRSWCQAWHPHACGGQGITLRGLEMSR